MHRITLRIVLFALVSLSHAPSAIAADPGARPTTVPVLPKPTIAAAPKFQCSITPPSGAGPYQLTSITIKHESGALTDDLHLFVRLGTQASGRPIARVCTSKFANNQVTLNPVQIRPPIIDPNYIWLCNAVASGKRRADQPPPGSQPPRVPK